MTVHVQTTDKARSAVHAALGEAAHSEAPGSDAPASDESSPPISSIKRVHQRRDSRVTGASLSGVVLLSDTVGNAPSAPVRAGKAPQCRRRVPASGDKGGCLPMSDQPYLLDVPAAAARLGVTQRWVRRAVAERRISFVKVGRNVRFEPEAITRYIERQRTRARDEAA